MDSRRWAMLLDEDGMADDQCAPDFQGLLRALVTARSNDPVSSSLPLPPGVSMEEFVAASIEQRDQRQGVVDLVGSNEHGDGSRQTGEGDDELALDNLEHDEDMFDSVTREPLRDMSSHAVWTVSTAKPGNGIEQLLDPGLKCYWQSDGQQPHTISAQFTSKLKISEVRLYLDFARDDSYTPAIISIRVGSSFHDLRFVRRNKELSKPRGWVRIPLSRKGIAAQEDHDDMSSIPSDEEHLESLAAGMIAERDQRRFVRAEHRRRRRANKHKAVAEKKLTEELTALARAGKATEDDVGVLEEAKRRKDRDLSFVRAHMLQIVIHTNHQNGRDSHVRRVKIMGPAQQVSTESSRFSSVAFQRYETLR